MNAMIAFRATLEPNHFRGNFMATNPVVCNLASEVIGAPKKTALRHGRSTEAEHRGMLREAPTRSRRRPLAEVLASMPNVGADEDFARSPE